MQWRVDGSGRWSVVGGVERAWGRCGSRGESNKRAYGVERKENGVGWWGRPIGQLMWLVGVVPLKGGLDMMVIVTLWR